MYLSIASYTFYVQVQYWWYRVLTGAVLVISVPRDSSHETDGRQNRYHPLESVKGTSVLTKGPISGQERDTWVQHTEECRLLQSTQRYDRTTSGCDVRTSSTEHEQSMNFLVKYRMFFSSCTVVTVMILMNFFSAQQAHPIYRTIASSFKSVFVTLGQ